LVLGRCRRDMALAALNHGPRDSALPRRSCSRPFNRSLPDCRRLRPSLSGRTEAEPSSGLRAPRKAGGRVAVEPSANAGSHRGGTAPTARSWSWILLRTDTCRAHRTPGRHRDRPAACRHRCGRAACSTATVREVAARATRHPLRPRLRRMVGPRDRHRGTGGVRALARSLHPLGPARLIRRGAPAPTSACPRAPVEGVAQVGRDHSGPRAAVPHPRPLVVVVAIPVDAA
jgi:hypothetical protein